MTHRQAEATADGHEEREQRLRRIRNLSRVMAMGCLVAAGGLTAAMALYWVVTPSGALFAAAGIATASPAELELGVRALAFLLAMIPLGALAYGLLSARRCFIAFADGHIFSRQPIGHLRTFAIAIAASALLKPFAGAALSVLLSASSTTGTRTLAFAIGSDTLIALIFSGMVAIIAWVMAEASDLADENQQFV